MPTREETRRHEVSEEGQKNVGGSGGGVHCCGSKSAEPSRENSGEPDRGDAVPSGGLFPGQTVNRLKLGGYDAEWAFLKKRTTLLPHPRETQNFYKKKLHGAGGRDKAGGNVRRSQRDRSINRLKASDTRIVL